MLNDKIIEKLKIESGISTEILEKAHVKHISASKAFELVGIAKDGVAFPYFNFQKQYVMTRLRKDEVVDGEGRYHQKKGSSSLLYFMKENVDVILDVQKPLTLVEAEKKLLSLMSNSDADYIQNTGVVGISGCWGAFCKNEEGEHKLSKDFCEIPLYEREVQLIPDSDYFYNPEVKRAYDKLIELLVEKGALVKLIDIRGESEEKLGLDDFLVKYGRVALNGKINNPIAVFNSSETEVDSDEKVQCENEFVKFPEMTGFMKELYNWILETSPVKQPILAYGSVISILGTVLSHLYRFNNAHPVFYQMFVARSGSGKDRPLKVAKVIFGNDELNCYLGMSSYRSDASIIDLLPEQRSRLDILDEVDAVLKISKSSNGYQSGIINILTELWSECNKYFQGRRSKEQGTYGNCWNPCVNIISALTPTAFRENFTKSMMLTGFGGRFLYYISNDQFQYTENFVGVDMSEVPDYILSPLTHWHRLKFYDEDKKRFNTTNLLISSEARDLLNQLRKKYFETTMVMDEENSLSPVMQRFYENLERLLIIHTCSQDPFKPAPIIQVENVRWCNSFLEALYRNNQFFIENNVTASAFEGQKSKILSMIANSGKNGKPHSKLLRDSHMTSKQVSEIIATLKESEQISEMLVKKAKWYFYIGKK